MLEHKIRCFVVISMVLSGKVDASVLATFYHPLEFYRAAGRVGKKSDFLIKKKKNIYIFFIKINFFLN